MDFVIGFLMGVGFVCIISLLYSLIKYVIGHLGGDA